MKKLSKSIFALSILLLFCCLTESVYSQTREELLKTYDSATIHSIGRFYYKGGSKLKFADLKNELTTPVPFQLYNKAKTDRVLGGILTVTSISALVASILLRKNNETSANILSGAAIVLNIGCLHFNKRSNEQTDRAIWQRNREILFGVK